MTTHPRASQNWLHSHDITKSNHLVVPVVSACRLLAKTAKPHPQATYCPSNENYCISLRCSITASNAAAELLCRATLPSYHLTCRSELPHSTMTQTLWLTAEMWNTPIIDASVATATPRMNRPGAATTSESLQEYSKLLHHSDLGIFLNTLQTLP